MSKGEESSQLTSQLSSLKSMAAQVVASSGLPVSSSESGFEGSMGIENKPGQQSSEQMRRKHKQNMHLFAVRVQCSTLPVISSTTQLMPRLSKFRPTLVDNNKFLFNWPQC